MNQYRNLFLILIALVALSCNENRSTVASNVTTKTRVLKEKSSSPKRIVTVSNTDNITVKVQKDTNQVKANAIVSDVVKEDKVKKDSIVSEVKQRVVKTTKKAYKDPAKLNEVAAKPVIKPKPKLVKSVPSKYLPAIQFDEVTYDFGEITEGDIVKHNFSFTNTGKTNLVIDRATATCGCTKPSFPFLDIKPGETGYIGVTYHSVNKEGIQTPEITVYSNAVSKSVTLYLKGIVKPKPQKEEEKSEESKAAIKDTIK